MAGTPSKGAPGLKAAITVAALAATLVGWAGFALGNRPADPTGPAPSSTASSPGPAAEPATAGAPRSAPAGSSAPSSSQAAPRGLRAVDVRLPPPAPRARPDVRTRASRRR